ncbi:nuclear transport factor 2 family protein [Aeromicrobium sp. YIM 150415]|uniref:nuclear transport factor 2 family protein n=1 Tax=Aeromicrobium sp. YIM 150415 TaxID=2803912 RepID=UPI0019668A6A|nr:nuclear transport factor 2 family protein [Aeromicrobium sp. YIM 150415]MBM9464033.1 nuclear transport factor 2 family protein [Aeromicrobium sp. YIM 150415]
MDLDDDTLATLRTLSDRQQIMDCLHRYTRGVDRLDREMLLSAFHADAIDDHGIFRGTAAEFADWAFDLHRTRHRGHQHYITNHTCDLDGDTAHTETYFMMVGQNVDGTPVTLHGGRYVDRLERRAGRWAIAYRLSLVEWVGGITPPDLPAAKRVQGGVIARDRSDVSYIRPLLP